MSTVGDHKVQALRIGGGNAAGEGFIRTLRVPGAEPRFREGDCEPRSKTRKARSLFKRKLPGALQEDDRRAGIERRA